MAEIITNTQNTRKGTRCKKNNPRVDMTPMVDLGFLLITFFMLSTTLMQPKTMNLIMPRDDGDPTALRASDAMTILLGGDNRIAWYEGLPHAPAIQFTAYDQRHGIGDILRRKRAEILQRTGKNRLMVLIKADEHANYRNVVDIMDEMLINDIDSYMLVDITPEERTYLTNGPVAINHARTGK